MSNVFTKPFKCQIPMDESNMEGYANGIDFINLITSGLWPEELGGSWINFIDSELNYTISVYFNDVYPEGTVVESTAPLFQNYPQDYPDAYMSWNKITGKIHEAYTKPGLRRTGIATTIAFLICIHRAQNYDEYFSIKPDFSNKEVLQLILSIETRYGLGPTRSPQHIFESGEVYNEFEKISLVEADRIFEAEVDSQEINDAL